MDTPEESGTKLDGEWTTLNAVRELIRLASRGDYSRATYDHALDLGAVICPEILGENVSQLRRARESDITQEFRQKAEAQTRRAGATVDALELVTAEIVEYNELLAAGKNQQKTDQLRRRLKLLKRAQEELDPEAHSEHQLIFRDAYNVNRDIPELKLGHGFKDFQLPDDNVLRLRVFHPDRPEHVTGADMIYERHATGTDQVSVVSVQYKVWSDKTLSLGDARMQRQIERLKEFACDSELCSPSDGTNSFRFPYCAAFLRPTDKLQHANQRLISSGEHLPVCQIEGCSSSGVRGAKVLRFDDIRDVSLGQDVFEDLFTRGKIGSRSISYDELAILYDRFEVLTSRQRVLIHAQDFAPLQAGGVE